MGPTITPFVCGLILFYFVAVGCLLLVENKGVLNKMNFGKCPFYTLASLWIPRDQLDHFIPDLHFPLSLI
jgi:hypothetical protein